VSKELDLSANWGEGQKVRQHVLTVWMFAVETRRVSSQNLWTSGAGSRLRPFG
jgi:hypothetical protein